MARISSSSRKRPSGIKKIFSKPKSSKRKSSRRRNAAVISVAGAAGIGAVSGLVLGTGSSSAALLTGLLDSKTSSYKAKSTYTSTCPFSRPAQSNNKDANDQSQETADSEGSANDITDDD